MSLVVDSTTSSIKKDEAVQVSPDTSPTGDEAKVSPSGPPWNRTRLNCFRCYYDSFEKVVTELPEDDLIRFRDIRDYGVELCQKAKTPAEYLTVLHQQKWFLHDTIGLVIQSTIHKTGKKYEWMHQCCRWTQLYM